MKKFLVIIIAFICFQTNAQTRWFTTYSDSAALVIDANKIVQQFNTKIKKLNPAIPLHNSKAIKNTTLSLIYIDSLTIHLPLWEEIIPQQKHFFTEVAGGVSQGEDVFGLFFNGFYLVHELGHSLSARAGKKFDNAYDSEFEANVVGILYWRSSGEKANLEKCYTYAKQMLTTLKDPVPENEDYKAYITKHYYELSSDPYKYGYIQFSQFVEIYEDKKLPDFDTFIKNYVKKPKASR